MFVVFITVMRLNIEVKVILQFLIQLQTLSYEF